jgi:hypothetical protein
VNESELWAKRDCQFGPVGIDAKGTFRFVGLRLCFEFRYVGLSGRNFGGTVGVVAAPAESVLLTSSQPRSAAGAEPHAVQVNCGVRIGCAASEAMLGHPLSIVRKIAAEYVRSPRQKTGARRLRRRVSTTNGNPDVVQHPDIVRTVALPVALTTRNGCDRRDENEIAPVFTAVTLTRTNRESTKQKVFQTVPCATGPNVASSDGRRCWRSSRTEHGYRNSENCTKVVSPSVLEMSWTAHGKSVRILFENGLGSPQLLVSCQLSLWRDVNWISFYCGSSPYRSTKFC